MATNANSTTDLFAPRKALTAHLAELVEQKLIRGVGQAEDLSEIISGKQSATHGFAYVAYDKTSRTSKQGSSSITSVQTYTVILAWQNNRPTCSNGGHGMDEAGEVLNAIEWHVHGYKIGSDEKSRQYHSNSTGKPFTLSDNAPEAFYRTGGWAFYPMSFDISLTRTRVPQIRN